MKKGDTKKQSSKVSESSSDRFQMHHFKYIEKYVLNYSKDAFFLIDRKAGFIDVNEAGCKHLGYSKDELLSMSVFDIDPNFAKEKWLFHWADLKKKKHLSFETLHRHKSGKVIPAEVRLNYFKIANKEYNFAYAIDISERKKMEVELTKYQHELETRVKERTDKLAQINRDLQNEIDLRLKIERGLVESEKKFRAAAKSTADLIWEGDVRSNSLIWHGDIDGILGYETGEFPRTVSGHLEHIHPDEQTEFIKSIDKAVKAGHDFNATYRIKCKDGTFRHWTERGKAVEFENGKAVKWVGSVTDVTESKKTFEHLKKSQKQYKLLSQEFNVLFNSIPDSLVLLSIDLKILWANEAFKAKLRNKKINVQGKICYKLCGGISTPCKNCPVLKCIASGKEESTRVTDPNGKILDKRAFPIMNESGKINKIIELARDITAQVRMEEEAQLVQSRLIHTNKMTSLGTLVSGVAHEINNPNSFIMANSQVFEDIWKDTIKLLNKMNKGKEDVKLGGIPLSELRLLSPQLLNGIKDGAARIKNIVESLREFSRPDKARLDGTVNVNTVISSARSILDNQIYKYTDNFTVKFGKEIPSIKGSSQQIEQVIINLIMNALQSLPDKSRGIIISTSYNKRSHKVVIKVKDEGIGIAKDIRDHVTEPFFTTRYESGGTGLGLSISYTIITDHDGTLSFNSAKESGTLVTVRLPVSNKGIRNE